MITSVGAVAPKAVVARDAVVDERAGAFDAGVVCTRILVVTFHTDADALKVDARVVFGAAVVIGTCLVAAVRVQAVGESVAVTIFSVVTNQLERGTGLRSTVRIVADARVALRAVGRATRRDEWELYGDAGTRNRIERCATGRNLTAGRAIGPTADELRPGHDAWQGRR